MNAALDDSGPPVRLVAVLCRLAFAISVKKLVNVTPMMKLRFLGIDIE